MYQSLLGRLLKDAVTPKWVSVVGLAAAIAVPTAAPGGQLALARVAGQPGQSITMAVTYRQDAGTPAAGLGMDLTFDPTVLANPRCAAGSALPSSGAGSKTAVCAEPQAGLVRLGVIGFDNVQPVPDGEVARLTFDVLPRARRGLYLLRQTPTGSDAEGTDFPLARRNGALRVNGP